MTCIDKTPRASVSSNPNAIQEFPLPDADAQAHSLALIDSLRQAIVEHGPIPFERFMNQVLYAPGLGYYSAGSRKFGEQGDFITAPEASPLFSQCLARQCAQILAQVGGDILEFGAGSGIMAADVLLQLESMDSLPQRYLILEVSAELKQRQEQTLRDKAAHLCSRVTWLESWPSAFRGVVLANEVLDAMPVQRLLLQDGAWWQMMVDWDGERFVWRQQAVPGESVPAYLAQRTDLPEPYLTEICPPARAWVERLAEVLDQGVALLIDYGFPRREYYHPQRQQGTLMCHYRHRAHSDPFVYPGLQDITAHVDFTTVAEAADAAGLSVLGYTHQAMFLIATGLEQAAAEVTDLEQQYLLAQQIKTLTLPSEMGELFKVMALGKGYDETPLLGFALHDMRGKL